jgi:hypothetical protein
LSRFLARAIPEARNARTDKSMNENRPITRLLGEWRNGDADALDQVMALVYDDLRDIAARAWQRESRQVTLEPSAIVHEAYLRLVQLKDIEWRDRPRPALNSVKPAVGNR